MKLLFSTLLSVLFAAFSADASNPVVEQFINGSGLIVSNNATVYWGASSVFTYDKLAIDGLYTGQPNKAFWSLTATNLLPTVVSNAYTGYTPGTLYWTNVGTAYSSASPYAGGYTVNTNIINPMAWNDVPGWCDGEGLPGQGCITATIGPGTAANTNLVTMVFAPIINGTNAVSYSGNAGGAAVEGVDILNERTIFLRS